MFASLALSTESPNVASAKHSDTLSLWGSSDTNIARASKEKILRAKSYTWDLSPWWMVNNVMPGLLEAMRTLCREKYKEREAERAAASPATETPNPFASKIAARNRSIGPLKPTEGQLGPGNTNGVSLPPMTDKELEELSKAPQQTFERIFTSPVLDLIERRSQQVIDYYNEFLELLDEGIEFVRPLDAAEATQVQPPESVVRRPTPEPESHAKGSNKRQRLSANAEGRNSKKSTAASGSGQRSTAQPAKRAGRSKTGGGSSGAAAGSRGSSRSVKKIG